MRPPFPGPTTPRSSRADVFDSYLQLLRNGIIDDVAALNEDEARSSRVASGWTPLELVKHLTFVERRWLEWGFRGVHFDDPWADQRDGRWFVADEESRDEVLGALREQGVVTSDIIATTPLGAIGAESERWHGDAPPTLERILFHLLQEYARHAGHLDIVVELGEGGSSE